MHVKSNARHFSILSGELSIWDLQVQGHNVGHAWYIMIQAIQIRGRNINNELDI